MVSILTPFAMVEANEKLTKIISQVCLINITLKKQMTISNQIEKLQGQLFSIKTSKKGVSIGTLIKKI